MSENHPLIPIIASALRDADLLVYYAPVIPWDGYVDRAKTALGLVRSWDASQNVVRVTMTTLDNFGSEIAMLRHQLNEALNRISR